MKDFFSSHKLWLWQTMQWVNTSSQRWTGWVMRTCMSKRRTNKKEGQCFGIQAELNKWPYRQLKTNRTQRLPYVTPTFRLPVSYDTQNLHWISNNWQQTENKNCLQHHLLLVDRAGGERTEMASNLGWAAQKVARGDPAVATVSAVVLGRYWTRWAWPFFCPPIITESAAVLRGGVRFSDTFLSVVLSVLPRCQICPATATGSLWTVYVTCAAFNCFSPGSCMVLLLLQQCWATELEVTALAAGRKWQVDLLPGPFWHFDTIGIAQHLQTSKK